MGYVVAHQSLRAAIDITIPSPARIQRSPSDGIAWLRDHYGPGYRVYFSFVGRNTILLLSGSTKRHQSRTIRQAKGYLEDYRRRTEL